MYREARLEQSNCTRKTLKSDFHRGRLALRKQSGKVLPNLHRLYIIENKKNYVIYQNMGLP